MGLITATKALLWVCLLIGTSGLAGELTTFQGVRLVVTPWADGDSFSCQLPAASVW